MSALAFVGGALLASCGGSSGSGPGPSGPAVQAGVGATAIPDAGAGVAGASGFGNAQDAGGAGPNVVVKFIDDGGIGVLPDGAMIYVTFAARPCPPGNSLSYENFGNAFFANYCRRCHSAQKLGSDRNDAPVGLNYDDLATIRMLASRIWGQAADSNRTMPAGAPLPSMQERTQLGEWLACGAPGVGP